MTEVPAVAAAVDTVAEADRAFAARADGGRVRMPKGKPFFAKRFGMLADRFGDARMVVAQR